MRIVIAIALALSCGACATVTRGTTEQIQITSEPAGAEVRTSLGHSCVSPCTIQVGRKDEFTVTVAKPGYRSQDIPVTTRVSGGGGVAFAGNVILGGVIGMGADVATGAALEHAPNPVSVDLVRVPASPPGRRTKPGRSGPPSAELAPPDS